MALAIVGTSALLLAITPAGRALAGAQAASSPAGAATPVIVFLKDQPAVSAASARSAARRDAIAASQAPLLRELERAGAARVTTYSLVNAFAATVPAGEEKALAADPAVAQVIPDATITGPPAPSATPRAGRPAGTAAPSAPLPGACLPGGKAELEPEGLALTHTDSVVRPRPATCWAVR